jgi:hypothetical protein
MSDPALIIAESNDAAEAIEKAIEGRIDTEVAVGGGLGSLLSRARSLMVSEGGRTVVIVEAHSSDDRFFLMWKRDAEDLLRMVGDGIILAATPDLATALADDDWIARLAEAVD